MPWIENVACTDIPKANHHDAGPNSMLIQIMDPPGDFPTPKYKFKEVHQFDFLDIEDDGMTNLGDGGWTDMSEFAITQEQAKELVRLLRHAYDNRMNVVTHCFAGLCRSGAVAQVGIEMGFDDVGNFKSPNTRVMRMMMEELELPYEQKEHNWREDYRQYLSMKVKDY
jgi:predicted protein tyrosine phosphatase